MTPFPPAVGAFCTALLLCCLAVPAAAQVRDTTRTLPQNPAPQDTVLAPPGVLPQPPADTSRSAAPVRPARPLVGFTGEAPGLVVGDTLPVLTPVLDATGLLAGVPASFVYAFGTPGWPDGWSPLGLAPHQVGLLLDERPFDDLLTGRPAYDLLPLAYAEPLRLDAARLARPVAVQAGLRPYAVPEPLTELHFQSGANGLQSIDAVHVQNRRPTFFGRPGFLQVLGAYSGRAAAGEYEGSRLRRGRQTLARVRYQRPGWSVELLNLHNRRRVGAHGGVEPLARLGYASIYNPFAATIPDAEAKRQIIRNDLAVTLRLPAPAALPGPLTVSAYWTAEAFRYYNRTDTTAAETDRYGVRAQQALPVGTHRLHLRLDAWLDALHDEVAVDDTTFAQRDVRRGRLHLSARDTLRAAGADLVAEAGLHVYGSGLHPAGALRLDRSAGPVRLFAAAALAGQPPAWAETHGFGASVVPGDGGTARPLEGSILEGSAGFAFRAGAFGGTVFGFGSRTTQPRDVFATEQEDTVAVHTLDAPLYRAGLAADLGWRRDAGRGFYATLQPTVLRLLNPGASADHRRLAATLPAFFVRGRLGARYLLFGGDLDLDLYLQGRFWTSMRSRDLHPRTALLVVPLATARTFGPSGLLDVVAEAGVRTATLFFAYENVLARTILMPGTLLVPDYPYPAQRFRFGVYWPIRN